jgi:quercetin dioxygenase-like cupin family protein
VELTRKASIQVFSNAGVASHQLLFPENSASRLVAITRVIVQPGAINPRHKHESSEQVWVALDGKGTLLLGEGRTESFAAGDVARFDAGDIHGFGNTGNQPFTYLSVTAPPINFRTAYEKHGTE